MSLDPDELKIKDILVVDDEPSNVLALEAALGDLALRVESASSGEDALAKLLAREFAVILLDVRMRGLDGFETAQIIRSRKKTKLIPIIFVTAFNEHPDDLRRAYDLGAVDFLFKPIVPEILRTKVRVFVELRDRTEEVLSQAERLRALEKRRFEDDLLRRRNEELAESDRRKDEFIAILAHEIRNPLAPLVTGLELMRNGDLTPDVSTRVRESMERQLFHLVRLVDDLLDVSKISQGKVRIDPKRVDLTTVVEAALEASLPTLDRMSHELVVELGGPLPVFGDPARLTQIVSNLLNNAVRYTAEGGRIGVHCRASEDAAILTVSDTGRGIEPKHLDRIFDMFVQEHDCGPGLGLGLSLVKKLVEMHGGTVRAHSDGPGKGSEFEVRLPVARETVAAGAIAQETQEVPPESLRIVLVEDDEDVRTTMRLLLEAWGHSVMVADNGVRGVELVIHEKPDVAILDLGLPGLDGFSSARRIRDQLGTHRPRLIAISGLASSTDRMRTHESGFDEHLSKPADPAILRRILGGIDS